MVAFLVDPRRGITLTMFKLEFYMNPYKFWAWKSCQCQFFNTRLHLLLNGRSFHLSFWQKKFSEMLLAAFVKRWNCSTDWKLLKLEGWVCWIPKSELISVFEFQLKFPFWEPVSCKGFLVIATHLNCSIFVVRIWIQHILLRKSRHCYQGACLGPSSYTLATNCLKC